jgi:hypothetical protein
MGRDAKRAKQVRRTKRQREQIRYLYSLPDEDDDEMDVSVAPLNTPDMMDRVISALIPGPATGDWRADVLGHDTISLRPTADGWVQINGHRVTPEMCEAIQEARPQEAQNFTWEAMRDWAHSLADFA